MPKWERVARLSDFPPGSATEVVVGDRMVALFNVNGELFALDGVCPHQGGPLGQGSLDGCIVTCPWHGLQFDVRTGQNGINASLRQPCVPVRVEGDSILVLTET